MDNIQRWLKSLRLHKYQPLFKALTYEEMLNLDEAFLINKQVTKGARNKILVSVRKLNMRQDRLLHLIDDICQGNLSLKEALTALSDMLITPIPQPATPSSSSTNTNNSGGSSISCSSISSPSLASSTSASASPASSTCSSTSGFCSDSDAVSVSSMGSLTSTASNDPHHLTYLFVDTFEKVAQHLIESPDYEDAACHGIMATIVDECLKHNSFTKEQKAKVARFRQPHTGRQYHRHSLQRRQLAPLPPTPQPLARQCHWHPFQRRQQQQQQPLLQQLHHHHHHHQQQQAGQQQVQPPAPQYHWHSLKQQQQPHQYPHQQSYNNNNTGISSNNNSSNGNGIGSILAASSNSSASRHGSYKEYSLLSPCLTFELPCLRARMSGTTS